MKRIETFAVFLGMLGLFFGVFSPDVLAIEAYFAGAPTTTGG